MDRLNKKIKAVAFDMGGVIAVSGGRDILEQIAEMLGVPADAVKQEYWKRNHLSNVENMKWEDMIVEVVRVFDTTPETEARTREFVRTHEAAREINHDLVAWFPKLRAIGLKVAILSNATTELRVKLEREGIAPLLDAIVISGEIGYQKPHKEAFDVLFGRLGLPPEEVVFVDDSPKSLEKAGEIGYIPVLYKNNEQLKRELEEYGIKI